MDTKQELMYWISERLNIHNKKDILDEPKPWSNDPVFQKTYFCNVHREDDKVTKFIRNMYNPYVDDPMFEYNMILARFINFPNTLEGLGYVVSHRANELREYLEGVADEGFQVWGGAYIITTHGMKMGKVTYLTNHVLEGVYKRVEWLRSQCQAGSLAQAFDALKTFEGLGPFLSAQVVADLKNTLGHALQEAPDWWTFVAPGPGSIRGASWFHYEKSDVVTYSNFKPHFDLIRVYVDENWPDDQEAICNQDLQNCLCEFDKYMRVKNGTGRSKRLYDGT